MPIYLVNSENKHIKSHCSTTESATYLLDPFSPYQSTVTFRGEKNKTKTNHLLLQVNYAVGLSHGSSAFYSETDV